MSKLKLAVVILIIGLCTISCKEKERTEPSVFIITSTNQKEGMDKMTYYRVEMPDDTHLGEVDFYFCDSVNKYKVGDVLYLKP